MNRVYLGYDSRERLAYNIAKYSILRRSDDVEVIPLKLSELPMLTRPIELRNGKLWCPISEAPMSTEFAVSRFCVPFLQKEGWALFVDSDILCLDNIDDIFRLADNRYAVMCVKHKQDVGAVTKKHGEVQTYYNRKNWSSVVLWNLNHPSNKILDLKMLNEYPGRDLHAFCWLDDSEIGELPKEWNHLVGIDPKIKNPKLIHFTLGTPNLWAYRKSDYADLWFNEYRSILPLLVSPEGKPQPIC